ncbi:TRAP transporter substrate-binding protein DctP [Arenimonas composti]|uniref:C4-dicarboxylate ABC transporter n=1 Tax=Arenimonas composti TR7-09 = DSM 18010 TaxID=1121013 RepID=A0A091BPQ7_9GAMM|nr:TRAP transporter substrate-binding protein DctP [Arenimonas composti]KFN46305.1 hypothetical protein P873_02000 [Arenimonas composti TR7-09 = DSM 18010]
MRLPSRCLALLLLLAAAMPAWAQTQIKIATLAPDGSSWMRELRVAAAEVEAGTGGRVQVKFYPGGVMGTDAVVLRKMRLGQLQGGVLTGSELSLVYPDAPAYSLPFLFSGWDEVARVRESVDPLLAAGFEERGIHMLGATGVGFAYFLGTKPMADAAAWRGLKLWIPTNDEIARRVFEIAGVGTIPLPIGDVFTSLQTGMIDTVANTPAGTVALQWHGKVRHMVDLPLTYVVAYLVLDQRAWERLSAGDQAVLARAFAAAAARMDANARRDDEAALAAMQRQGLQVSPPDPAEAARWRRFGEQVQRDMEADGSLSPAILAAIRAARGTPAPAAN